MKFDGFDGAALLDAKGPGFGRFVNADGTFKPWFGGSKSLLDQAKRQISAADGTPIDWYVGNQNAATAISDLLSNNGITGINVIFKAPGS